MSKLYQLPDGWEWKKLGEVSRFIRGITFKPSERHETPTDSTIFCFRTTNIQNELDDTDLLNINSSLVKSEDKIVQNGDILISSANSLELLGKCCLVRNIDYRATLGGFIVCGRANQDILNTNYYFYYFSSAQNQQLMRSLANKTTGIANLPIKAVENKYIPVPQLEEQKRIVQKLDALFERIDKAIALLQKNIDAADNFMNSVLNDVFSDLDGRHSKRTLFSFDFGMSAGGTPLRQNKLFWENGTIEWFSSGELNQLFTKPANEKITQIGLENSSAKLFESGTLLIGMYDTAAMKMSILSNDGSCNQAIVGFKPDAKELNIYFAKYQLEYLKPVILEQRQGVRQKNLNLTKIKNIEISYPDLIIQNKVVDFLDDVSAKIAQVRLAQQQKMQNLLDLKSSILDQAFHGKL